MQTLITSALAVMFVGIVVAPVGPASAPAQLPARNADLDEGVLRRTPIAIGEDFIKGLTQHRPGTTLDLKLFDVPVVAVARRVQTNGPNVNWFGTDDRFEIGDVILTVVNGSLMGTFFLDSQQFNIRPTGTGGYAVEEIDTRAFGGLNRRDTPLPDPSLETGRYPDLESDPEGSARMFEHDLVVNGARSTRHGAITTHHPNPDSVLTHFPEDGSRVDLLVGYTSAARERLAEAGFDVTAAAQHMVNIGNWVLSQSGVNTQLNLVHVEQVTYAETVPDANDPDDEQLSLQRELDDLQNSNNAPPHPDLAVLHELRDTHRADLVTLLVFVPTISPQRRPSGGLAHGLTEPADPTFQYWQNGGNGQFDEIGFNVVNVNFTSQFEKLFIHEVGHNFGARHDRYQLRREDEEAEENNPGVNFDFFGRIPGAFGYVATFTIASQPFRTIMAYATLCNDLAIECQWLPRFSDPTQTYFGWPMGISAPNALTDNRSVLNLTRYTVANFRHALFP